ncbi:hypothetical protein DC31_03715 [Microbacterium sp. CH12i]|uniref:hypothetical protein n=1 Tax=Microbacterium sp. CH12i TaxID=1479651 RepID=UPI00046173C0|nr:hypothetical protein [Microbacterium sp. CH12i]KDA05111.1 hypothetical protein DC31_03715 [Microbacterium sp. CH12i]
MEWIADVSVGNWLRERLSEDWSIHHFVPHDFEACARVFHAPSVRSAADAADAVGEATTWAAAAAAFGTTLHAQASWQHLVKTPTEGSWHTRVAPDGRKFSAPSEGNLDDATLNQLATHLLAHTTTPDDGFAAVWEGWGGLVGDARTGPSQNSLTYSEDAVHQQMLQQSIYSPLDKLFQRRTWHPGILSDEISKGPRLELPDRDHVLFSAAPSMFTQSEWRNSAPWDDEPLSLLWPADHAWVVVTEIDYDSTIVAGSNELIRAICTDSSLEALPLREGASLHWDADDINR